LSNKQQSGAGSADQGPEWVIRSQRVLTESGLRPVDIRIKGGVITAVGEREESRDNCPVFDVGEHAILPGIIDTHVHINEPGRTEWEGFTTATRAAAAGGITTLVDMPLNSSPVTTTARALAIKISAAQGKLAVDCGFYGGLVGGLSGTISELVAGGVLGFKAFLCHSGIDEFPNVTETDLRAAMPEIARAGVPLLVHAELLGPAPVGRSSEDGRSYARHLASRPRAWEHDAIALMIALCREYRCRVHIVHLASADALPMIAQARAEGLPLSVETCPHYLTFAAEEIPDGDPRYKCAPPIREQENRERLWEGLRQGQIDTIGSDHSPAPPELKYLETGDVARAWGGIASLQLGLPAVWTEAQRRGFGLADLTRWMARNPAELVGLSHKKGRIAPGHVADLIVFDPEHEFSVDCTRLYHRHPATPYEGRRLLGRVITTYLRGRAIYSADGIAEPSSGQTIRRHAQVAEEVI
jgi:allantoinase